MKPRWWLVVHQDNITTPWRVFKFGARHVDYIPIESIIHTFDVQCCGGPAQAIELAKQRYKVICS